MKLLVLFTFTLTSAYVTKMYFKNLCPENIDVIRIEPGKRPFLEVTLPPNTTRLTAVRSGTVSFRPGWQQKTTASYIMDELSLDKYFINIINGFDVALAIEPYEGQRISCLSQDCPDGVRTIKEISSPKVHNMKHGGEFRTIFCPIK